jgi:tRNA nucleotidyltransferase (CCA-adding enzyme)
MINNLVTSEVKILTQILGKNCELYLVGGAVRDALINIVSKDIDLATSLRPEEVIDRLTKANIRCVPTGIIHGTVTALINNLPIEITTFRQPSSRTSNKYSDSILTDLSGRDFTINAIAINLKTLGIVDPYSGVKHLKENQLIAVGDPLDRFKEDPLRILRMVRFGTSYGRKIDQDLLVAATKLNNTLKHVSIERIREELVKILIAPFAHLGFITMKATNILEVILPEIIPTIGCEQNKYHYEDVFLHTLTVLSRTKEDLILRLTALFHDSGKPHTVTIDKNGERHFYQHEHVGAKIAFATMIRLKFSKKIIDQVTRLVDFHMRPLNCGSGAIRRLMRDLDSDLILWREFKYADKSPLLAEEQFLEELAVFDEMVNKELKCIDRLAKTKLVISGTDLMEAGIPQGPILGIIIKALQEVILDNPELNNSEYLLNTAKNLVKSVELNG